MVPSLWGAEATAAEASGRNTAGNHGGRDRVIPKSKARARASERMDVWI